ncbi:peptidoglycan DD-metalloendopeptidase family protein [Massilia sp. PAMC28688]|uniref:peptidoglycan DD-metalloendopeptidase family protein n=1 Tax=Massilia sp. PAMC28688 TaxID=2861283 RepID=UPI001C637FE0|nr:peptidoglycan DD-metalloendopeptidase family protein [Massilia sp. PAMC28688]QYF92295.1 peptidoglycan DD-metalloendopeptidase family protein [Massilia sp. PAMC28688]
MKRISHISLLIIALGLLSACTSSQRRAPVVERSPHTRTIPPAAPEAKDERGFYTVKKGDTLLRIALDYGQNYRDLVTWNNLSNPNDIKVDQVLRVAPPEQVAGVQTMPVLTPPPSEKVQPPIPKKTSPKGEKRPYSDAALADLRGDGAPKEPRAADKNDAPDAPPARPVASATPGAIAPGAVVTATDDEKLSWMWPANGKIVATFDEGKNKGIDIAGRAGQQVMAAGAGKVMYAGSGIRGYGNLVIVKHSNSLLSAYAHNRSIVVKEGDTVSKGQVIAEMGDSDADSVKLHFEIRQQGKPVDPTRFLPSR